MLFQHLFAAGIMTVLLWIAIILGLAALSKKAVAGLAALCFQPVALFGQRRHLIGKLIDPRRERA